MMGYTRSCDVAGEMHKQKGFTLLELMLTVAVAATLLLGLSAILQELAKDEFAENTADYMIQVGEATEDMLRDYQNFDILYRLTEALLSDSLEIPLSYVTEGNDFGGGDVILPSSLISTGFSIRSPLRTDVTILLSVADDPLVPNDPRALNVLIMTEDERPDDRVVRVARRIGAQGGYYRDDPTAVVNSIQGAHGGWEVNFSDVSNTAWHSNVLGQGTLSIETGSYLTYYSYVNEEDVFGDYLYRIPQPGRPDLHVMNGTLNLGTYNILGVDNLYVSGNATVSNDIIVQGSAYIFGTMAMAGSLFVEERINAGSINVGDGNIATSETFFVQRDLLVDTAFSVDSIQTTNAFFDSLSLSRLQAEDFDVVSGAVDVTSDAGASIGGLVNGGALNVSDTLQAQILNISSGGFSPGGDVGIVNFSNSGAVSITGALNVDDVQSEGVTNFFSLGGCSAGCN